MSSHLSSNAYRFRRHDTIGAIDASEDARYLTKCFVNNNSELDILRDTSDSRCIVLGRTGVGKTALLSMLQEEEENVKILSPFDLALHHLSNRPALQFYMDIGINLDLFFRVLWSHVLTKELIVLDGSSAGDRRISIVLESIKNAFYLQSRQKRAQKYLKEYGDFWQDTYVRIMEEVDTLVNEVTDNIDASLGAKVRGVLDGRLGYQSSNVDSFTHEERQQIVKIGQDIVNKSQMQELSDVINLLSEELGKNRQKKYFITLDSLDENWIDNALRNRIIYALFATIRRFNEQFKQLKVICAIREDLMLRVLRFARDLGVQQEKYLSICLRLYWNDTQLENVLEKRLNQLMVSQYAKNQPIRLREILPENVYGCEPVAYLIKRTLYTPRDIILFFNECILNANGESHIDLVHIESAENSYSRKRLEALADEWSSDYSTLENAAFILKDYPSSFGLGDLQTQRNEQRVLDFLSKNADKEDSDEIFSVLYDGHDLIEQLTRLLRIFYMVGIVGIFRQQLRKVFWSHQGDEISDSYLDEEAVFHIHPAFYRILGTKV